MGVPQSQRCGVGSILSQGWPVPTSLPLFLSISLFPADGQATSTSSLETDLQGGPPLVLFSAGPPPSHVAAVVLNGFEHSRLVEKRQHRAGALRDKELQESSLMDAGRLSLVSFPPQGGNSAQTVLTICLPDAGVVKYDPVLRRNWLELIDLVNLQIRVAQQVLQGAAGQDVSVVQVLQKVNSDCARIGLDELVADVRDRFTFKQNFIGSTRTKAMYSKKQERKEQNVKHCKTVLGPLLQKYRARPGRIFAGQTWWSKSSQRSKPNSNIHGEPSTEVKMLHSGNYE